MNLIAHFIAWIFDSHPTSQERDERYLSAAVDLVDLEHRIRILDERRPAGPFGLSA